MMINGWKLKKNWKRKYNDISISTIVHLQTLDSVSAEIELIVHTYGCTITDLGCTVIYLRMHGFQMPRGNYKNVSAFFT